MTPTPNNPTRRPIGRPQPARAWLAGAMLAGTTLAGTTLALLWASPAQAQLMPNPTVEQLVGALAVDDASQYARAFRRTLPPGANGHCPEAQADAGATGRNIVIVPYQPQPSARVDVPLQFGDDSDALKESDLRTLNTIAQAMKTPQLIEARFALAGHTSSTGSRARNLELSCARSLAVRRYLIAQGVAAERLSAYGFGFDRPLPGRPGEDAMNRRVEINRE